MPAEAQEEGEDKVKGTTTETTTVVAAADPPYDRQHHFHPHSIKGWHQSNLKKDVVN